MLKPLLMLIAICISLFATPLQSVGNYNEGLRIAKAQNKPLLLFFHTQYCGWCTKMKKTTLKDPKVIEHITKNYIFVSLDRDKDSFPEHLMPRFVPTTYIVDSKTNQEIDAIIGYKNNNDFLYALSGE